MRSAAHRATGSADRMQIALLKVQKYRRFLLTRFLSSSRTSPQAKRSLGLTRRGLPYSGPSCVLKVTRIHCPQVENPPMSKHKTTNSDSVCWSHNVGDCKLVRVTQAWPAVDKQNQPRPGNHCQEEVHKNRTSVTRDHPQGSYVQLKLLRVTKIFVIWSGTE